ncbi:hypothetical protein FOXYSP1_02758 [Fusarium oxysporum f. sp. phaseoli]
MEFNTRPYIITISISAVSRSKSSVLLVSNPRLCGPVQGPISLRSGRVVWLESKSTLALHTSCQTEVIVGGGSKARPVQPSSTQPKAEQRYAAEAQHGVGQSSRRSEAHQPPCNSMNPWGTGTFAYCSLCGSLPCSLTNAGHMVSHVPKREIEVLYTQVHPILGAETGTVRVLTGVERLKLLPYPVMELFFFYDYRNLNTVATGSGSDCCQ